MTVPSYQTLAPRYAKLWAELVPSSEHLPELTSICNSLVAHKAAYQEVEQSTGVAWWVVALIDQMEGGGGAKTYLGNGQSLAHVTTEVPIGRGPFANFHDGAVDALHLDGLDSIKSWPIERVAYQLEAYNGWGYLNKPIEDPYLASFSNKYAAGKYVADHVYDPNAVSAQPGALTILKVLVGIDPTIALRSDVPAGAPMLPTPVPTPIPTPTPILVTGIDAAAIQAKLAAMAPYVAMLTSLHDVLVAELKAIADITAKPKP